MQVVDLSLIVFEVSAHDTIINRSFAQKYKEHKKEVL